MLIDVTLPQLGESVAEGTISKWLVREGDVVQKDQPLVSIATDKADSELPSPVGGRIAKLLAAEGAVVPVKTVIAADRRGSQRQRVAVRGARRPRIAFRLPCRPLRERRSRRLSGLRWRRRRCAVPRSRMTSTSTVSRAPAIAAV